MLKQIKIFIRMQTLESKKERGLKIQAIIIKLIKIYRSHSCFEMVYICKNVENTITVTNAISITLMYIILIDMHLQGII